MPRSDSYPDKVHISGIIDEDARKLLKQEAFCALKSYFGVDSCHPPVDEKLDEIKLGAFVTLKDGGNLRGCIGFVSPERSVIRTVRDAAILAATEDPRFIPVSPYEIGDLEIEVTVLGDAVPLDLSSEEALDSIVIGTHGLIAESKFGRGILLPQVAKEWNFSSLEFVEATCLKAGLNRGDWKRPDVRIYVFEGIDF